ncbi:MAG TPA: FoF1 ATP synthase subunit a [Candidatus Cryosericum sp.]|nr:FoF1 ATP synthase subunit a [Candidatus Cryosericum sp.]
MQMPSVGKIIALALSLLLGAAALVFRSRVKLPAADDPDFAAAKKKRSQLMMLGVVLLWVFSGLLFGLFTGGTKTFEVSISPARMQILGFSVSSSVVIAWIVIAAFLVIALLIRFLLIPRFKETPRGLQLILETAVGAVSDFTKEKFGHANENLAAYFFALAALFIGSAAIELFGFRPPTADLTMTLSYALVTFVLINYYGIRRKGVKGRIRTILKPNPVVSPFKILSDIAVPVSLACRLFGNIFGGMIVVELLYYALGAFSVGIPAVLGLYFNAFHPLIQFFIFINLSLTFIGEAVEED